MPIYLDRHDMPDEITAEHVAEMHQMDLKVQHKFGCRGFTYWFDDKKKLGFCLIEAPDKGSIKKMHDHAHGGVPSEIIEVDATFLETFLGRIVDPEKAMNTKLNIINEPAFRILMIISVKDSLFGKNKINNALLSNLNKSICSITKRFEGRVVKNESKSYLSSFFTVSNAIMAALEIQKYFKKNIDEKINSGISLNIGLNSGVPVTDKERIFEDTISLAERMCDVARGVIVVSSEVNDLYEIENLNSSIDKEMISILNPTEEKFLNHLMDFIEKTWNKTNFKVDDFGKDLGLSKSQLYRKLKSLTGKSPNTFIKEYRLDKAITLLNKNENNISEIAFETGFNSPSYFSKCFLETYGILPSNYLK